MFIIKLLLKILLLPIISFLAIVNIAGMILTKISSYVVGTMILLLLVFIVVACIEKNISNVIISIIFGVVAYGLVFMIAIFSEIVKETNGKLIRFLAS